MDGITTITAQSPHELSSPPTSESVAGSTEMKRKLEGEKEGSRKRSKGYGLELEETGEADLHLDYAYHLPSGRSVEETSIWIEGALANVKEKKRKKTNKAAELKFEQMEKEAIETLKGKKGHGEKAKDINFENEEEAREYIAREKERDERRRQAAYERTQKKANESSSWLSKRAGDRMAGRKPAVEKRPTLVYRDFSHSLEKTVYEKHMVDLPLEKPTAEHSSDLAAAQKLGPNYLSRAASLTHGYRFDTYKRGTNGFTAQNLVMPAADTTPKHGLYASIGDFRQGELMWMIAHHLMWTDLPQDQFSSYTNSPIFVVTHALGRCHTGQQGTTIQFLDRRKALGIDTEPAKFYPALKLYEIFKVPTSPIWSTLARQKLHARKFTQEYLSHHTVRLNDTRFQQARIEVLIRDGLYDIFPAFEVETNHLRAGLYTSQVVSRKIGFPPTAEDAKKKKLIYSYDNCSAVVPITNELLAKVKKITLNFMLDNEMDVVAKEPHLHTFITFLCFEKRPRNDVNFMTWMATHYKAADVIDLFDDGAGGVQPGFTHVANNLPDVMQYLDLVRDACDAFGLQQIPDNVISTHNVLSGDHYEAMDINCHQKDEASKAYDRDAQRDARDKANAKRREKNADEKRRRAAGLVAKSAIEGAPGSTASGANGNNGTTFDGGALGLGIGTAIVSSQDDPTSVRKADATGTVVEQATADA